MNPCNPSALACLAAKAEDRRIDSNSLSGFSEAAQVEAILAALKGLVASAFPALALPAEALSNHTLYIAIHHD